jgi:hypothetical protein
MLRAHGEVVDCNVSLSNIGQRMGNASGGLLRKWTACDCAFNRVGQVQYNRGLMSSTHKCLKNDNDRRAEKRFILTVCTIANTIIISTNRTDHVNRFVNFINYARSIATHFFLEFRFI